MGIAFYLAPDSQSAANDERERLPPLIDSLAIPPDTLRIGDVVFRREDTMISRAFGEAGKTQEGFSHAGVIIAFIDDQPLIAHMEDYGLSDDLQIESLEKFLGNADLVTFYRSNSPLKVDSATITARFEAIDKKRPISFDYEFLASNDALYCTEFVWHILRPEYQTETKNHISLEDLKASLLLTPISL